jgi:hypothetical protein
MRSSGRRLETRCRQDVSYSPGSPPGIADKALRLFALEIEAMSKAMAAWEPVVEDAARKHSRRPLMRCGWAPPSTRIALGPNITCDVCCKPFLTSLGRRISQADRV